VNWRISILCTLLVGGVLSAGPSGRLEPPPLLPREFFPETFGMAKNVALLADLLDESDPTVREQATRNLGETHNRLALPHLRKALKDEDINVRIAAVEAFVEFEEAEYGPVLLGALADEEDRLVLAALRCIGRRKFTAAADRVRRLLDGRSDIVRRTALETLNELSLSAGSAELKLLLRDESPALRLRAAENALFERSSGDFARELMQLARSDDSPAVRGAALAAAAKLRLKGANAEVTKALREESPLIRRGAVRACAYLKRPEAVREFLDDASPMVRLAAIRAAGQLKDGACAKRLMELLQEVPDLHSHLAARDSLARIGLTGGSDVASMAAKLLESSVGDTVSERSVRNIRAGCWLLGEFKSRAALRTRLDLLRTLSSSDIGSPILIDLAYSLGRLGDASAVKPLQKALSRCRENGSRVLKIRQSTAPKPPPEPPYSDEVTRSIIEALAAMKATGAVGHIIDVAMVRVKAGRLNFPAATAMRVLPDLVTPANRSAIERCIVAVLGDPLYDKVLQSLSVSSARIDAARAAVRLKLRSALPALRAILSDDQRPCRAIIHAAAWAIQELTGRTPLLPDPKQRQGQNWIVRQLGS